MESTLTGVFEQVQVWYIGYAQELPGANVQERTLETARESLREAIQLILLSNCHLADKELRLNSRLISLDSHFT
ncbi:MAG TPA: hypothetical protein V6C50_00685 [Crinalium sp.]